MKHRAVGIQRWLQVSSGLVLAGLLVEAVSIAWSHPLSFVLFVFVGTLLLGLGIVIYLASLVFALPRRRPAGATEADRAKPGGRQ